MTEWVRYYHDTPTDPKWRVIAKKAGARLTDVLAVWSVVLVNASANANERGRTLNIVTDDIGAALDLEAPLVDAILDAMKGKVMDAKGYLTGWEKRNPIKDDGAAERAKRWRERKRTQTNGANALDTDTDTDTDKKKEKSGAVAPAVSLPDWVDPEAWADFMEVRRKRKAVNSPRAIKNLISTLDGLRLKGHDPTAILNTSITNSWKDFYEPKAEAAHGRREKAPTAHDNHNAGTVLYLQKLERESRGQGPDSDPPDPPGKLLLAPGLRASASGGDD